MSKEYFSVMETSPFNYCLWYVNELACHLSYALFLSLSPRLIGTPLPACLPLNLLLSNLLLPQQLPSFFRNSESCVKTLLNMRAFLSLSVLFSIIFITNTLYYLFSSSLSVFSLYKFTKAHYNADHQTLSHTAARSISHCTPKRFSSHHPTT